MLRGFLVFLLILLLFPTTTLAQNNIEIVDLPESVANGEKFELSVEISMSASSTYYIKARVGNTLSSMRNALTHNSSTKTWLSDTSAWSKLPTFSTNENGLWAGIVNVKIRESTPLGSNLILIRIRKVGTTKNLDSEAKTIEVVAANQTTSKDEKTTITSNLKVILNEFSPAPEGNRE